MTSYHRHPLVHQNLINFADYQDGRGTRMGTTTYAFDIRDITPALNEYLTSMDQVLYDEYSFIGLILSNYPQTEPPFHPQYNQDDWRTFHSLYIRTEQEIRNRLYAMGIDYRKMQLVSYRLRYSTMIIQLLTETLEESPYG